MTLIIGSLVLGQLLKNTRWKKRLTRSGLVCLILFTNPIFVNTAMKIWEVSPIPLDKISPGNTVGIVLTGVTKKNKDFQDRVFFYEGADRVTHAIQLYKEGLIQKIIISGGSGNLFDQDIREADQLISVFTMCGVPRTDLIIERDSRNTRESVLAVSSILKDQFPNATYLLITSGFHMRRAQACFNKIDVMVTSFSTDSRTSSNPVTVFSFIRPSPNGLYRMQLLAKELLGYTAYKIAGYV